MRAERLSQRLHARMRPLRVREPPLHARCFVLRGLVRVRPEVVGREVQPLQAVQAPEPRSQRGARALVHAVVGEVEVGELRAASQTLQDLTGVRADQPAADIKPPEFGALAAELQHVLDSVVTDAAVPQVERLERAAVRQLLDHPLERVVVVPRLSHPNAAQLEVRESLEHARWQQRLVPALGGLSEPRGGQLQVPQLGALSQRPEEVGVLSRFVLGSSQTVPDTVEWVFGGRSLCNQHIVAQGSC
eukprot:2234321-Rhodomonas_salina.1